MPNDSKIQYIPSDDLHFDPMNPRLPSTIKGNNERDVIAYFLREESLIELMGSIGEQDYFAGEPMLVCENPNEKGKYWVVEGNRRLASVKLLNNPSLAPSANKYSVEMAAKEAVYRPNALPVVIYSSREEMLKYLSYRHITGIKAWNPLQKSKYLDQLRQSILEEPINQQLRSLAKSIGTRADYVARLLTGYAIYQEIAKNNFFDIPGLDEETISYAVLTTALQYAKIKVFLGVDINDNPDAHNLKKRELGELSRWMFEENSQGKTRLGESRNLRLLSEVVGEPKALKAFRNGMPLKEAKDLTEEPTILYRQSVGQSRKNLTTARDTIHLVSHPTVTDDDSLAEVQALARDLRTIVKARVLALEDIA